MRLGMRVEKRGKKREFKLLHLGLLFKKLPLSNWIIQLSVRIADLLLHHEELKTLR